MIDIMIDHEIPLGTVLISNTKSLLRTSPAYRRGASQRNGVSMKRFLAAALILAGAQARADFGYDLSSLMNRALDEQEEIQASCGSKVVMDFEDYYHSSDEISEFENGALEQVAVLVDELRKACLGNPANKEIISNLTKIKVRRGSREHRHMEIAKSGDMIYYAAKNKNENGLNVSNYIDKDLIENLHLKFGAGTQNTGQIEHKHKTIELAKSELPIDSKFTCSGYSQCDEPYDTRGVLNGVETCFDGDKIKKTVTWKNGQREGVARCFDGAELKVEAIYSKNFLEGPLVTKKSDSRGDLAANFVHGRETGFELYTKDAKLVEIGFCRVDGEFAGRVDQTFARECEAVSYGPNEMMLRAGLAELRAKDAAKAAALKARQNGPQVEKYDNGNVRAKYTTKNGKIIGLYKSFYEDGKPKLETEYSTAGEREGNEKEFDADGKPKVTAIYQGDEMVSRSLYYMNGVHSTVETWTGKAPKKKRCQARFDDLGAKVSYACVLEDSWYGVYDGPFEFYFHGKPGLIGQFAEDRRIGIWKYYDADGRLEREAKYDKGVLVSETAYAPPNKIYREFHPDGSIKTEKKTLDKKI
jgi:antitoxin component YwqK of YwqJK toxin-antitoxin module